MAREKQHPTYNRRPSFDIAADYVELNFRPIIAADAEASMSPKELRAKRRAEKKAAHQRRPRWVYGVVAAAVLLVIAGGTALFWWHTSAQAVNLADKSTRQFQIDRGASASEVADSLAKSGFIRSPLAFKIYARLHDSVLQAGTHVLSPSYDLEKTVKTLATAETDEIEVQIPAGMTISEIKKQLKQYDYTDSEIEEAFNKTYDSPILDSRPTGQGLEGYLYPDTYRVYRSDSVDKVIQKALDQFEKIAKANKFEESFKAHGLSLHEGITLASIVTKEVSNSADQKMVAGVFYNRLAAGMNLGSDVTYKYAYNEGLCSDDSPTCDSEYNTRVNEGLPPGPIATPTLTALMAVANPTNSNYYYFVAGEDGKTYYSETEDQHNQAVAEHCGDLCQ